jgi:hypothetical protein
MRFDRMIPNYNFSRIVVLNYQNLSNKGISLALSVKSWYNTQNIPLLFQEKKMLRFRCWSEFNEIYKNTYTWIFENFKK